MLPQLVLLLPWSGAGKGVGQGVQGATSTFSAAGVVETCQTRPVTQAWGRLELRAVPAVTLQMGDVTLQAVHGSSACPGCTSEEEIVSSHKASISQGREPPYQDD